MEMRLPFEGRWPITDDYAAHVARESTAPGIDFACSWGTEILAPADGKVIRSEWSERGGRYVMIDHGGEYQTLYSHLSVVRRLKNERVQCGDKIALSGNTGWSTGAHLHFAVKRGGRWVDPEKVLARKE